MSRLIKIPCAALYAAIFMSASLQAHAASEETAVADTSRPVWRDRLEEVVVTGTRNVTDIRHLPMTVSVVGRSTIERSGSASLLPVLTEQVPGLFSTARGIMGYGVSDGSAGSISLRGMSGGSGRLMVLIDGHPQYMGLFGHPIADVYQSFLAERVEVLRGPASVLYGSNAMGGVVNIVTRKMTEDGSRTALKAGYGSYNTLRTELTSRIRKKGFSSVVGASYNRTDGHRADMGFEQYSSYIRLGYEISRRWSVSGDVSLTHFNASNPGGVSDPIADADQSVTRGMASVSIENRYEKTSGGLSFFYNWGRHDINDGYHPFSEDPEENQPLDYRFHSRDVMMGVSIYQSAQLFSGNRITAGVDWFRFGGDAWNEYVAGENKGHNMTVMGMPQIRHEIAGYLDLRQQIGSWLTFDAGLRVDHHTQAGTEWVPQAGLSFHLPASAGIKVSVAKGFRYPLIREMFMWGIANPGLKAESMWNYEIAFSQTLLDGRLSYGVNIFYLDARNLIVQDMVDGRMMNVNAGAARNTGVEAQAAWRIGRAWSVDANYSWLYMDNPIAGSPQHKLYGGAMYMAGRWQVSTGLQYINGLYTSTGTDASTENFLLWNLRASFRITDWLSVWAAGENLLARKYEINAGYPMPGATVTGGVSLEF